MALKVTPWFERSDRPVRSGLYQCKSADGTVYWCYFSVDTNKWGLVSLTQEGAIGWRERPSVNQYRRWRGVFK